MSNLAKRYLCLLLLCSAPVLAQPGPTKPRAIEAAPPVYPEAEKAARHEGRVVVQILVLKDGSAGTVQLAQSSGYPALDQAALDAVKQWRFEPGRDESGAARDTEVKLAVSFKLDAEPADPQAAAEAESRAAGDAARQAMEATLKQSCAALTAEAAVFLKDDPNRNLREMETFRATTGILFSASANQSMAARLQFVNSLTGVYAAVVEQCRKTPAAVYENVLAEALKGTSARLPSR
jgi:TonB family protein